MNKRIKLASCFGLGSGIGTATFPLFTGEAIDWQKTVFVAIITVLLVFILPRRWIDRLPPKEEEKSA